MTEGVKPLCGLVLNQTTKSAEDNITVFVLIKIILGRNNNKVKTEDFIHYRQLKTM